MSDRGRPLSGPPGRHHRAVGLGLSLCMSVGPCGAMAAPPRTAAAAPSASDPTKPATTPAALPTGAVPRLVRSEPPRDSARHVGDVVVSRALIEWPAGWALDRDGLPASTREDGPIELRSHAVEPADEVCAGCKWLTLQWQVFKAVHITADVTLPATPVRLRKGTQIVTLQLPASPLAVSPLVPWERRADWAASARPGWQARPFEVHARWVELAGGLAVAALALAGWAWSSGRWLPRRSQRPFAAAWRATRARQRAQGGELPQADTEDLRCWHRAFDATAGESVFAETLADFFARQSHLAPLADEVRAVFAASQRAFYLDPKAAPATRVALQDLLALLHRLAELEFRPVAGAARGEASGASHAPV